MHRHSVDVDLVQAFVTKTVAVEIETCCDWIMDCLDEEVLILFAYGQM